jgi:hypothetical protein
MSSKAKKSEKIETKTSTKEKSVPDQVDRNQMISEAAYYIAEQRGFTPAQENEDWLEAEKQIGEMFGETNGNIVMNIQKEFDELTDVLKQQRGEIELQIHLASMDAKQEWKKAEKTWEKFVDDLDLISDDTKESGAELVQATKIIGDELKEAYHRISERLD